MIPGGLMVDSRGQCESGWHGTTIFEKTSDVGIYQTTETLTFKETLMEKMDEDSDIDFIITSQSVSVTGGSGIDIGCLIDTCTGNNGHTITYSGNVKRDQTENDESEIIRFSQAGKNFEFIGTDEVYGGCDYVTETRESFSTCKCDGIGIPFSSTSVDTEACHVGPMSEVTIPVSYNEYDLERMSGTKEYVGDMFTETITWDYIYE